MTVLIAGAGIASLTLGLTLHQIGVPFRIFEATRVIKPLGVGINLQPNAVRELFDLGLEDGLERIGVRTRQYGFYTKTGRTIWEEPRGTWSGYNWPQYSVHRGKLQMLLYETLIARAGADCVVTGQRATGFDTSDTGVSLMLGDTVVTGACLIAADGIHSAIRAQMHPSEGAPKWNGAVLWRGTSQAQLPKGEGAMILAGHDTQRIVAYPISSANPETGDATINWIAELRVDPTKGWKKEDWNRAADLADFLPQFEDWTYDWLDFPALVRGAGAVYEYPMVDRDPLDHWTDGLVSLIGDAAHPTYPVGSNGASQAIIDARVLGAAFRKHDVTTDALLDYETAMRPRTTNVTLANRGSGPDAILQRVEDLCSGVFDEIDDVISHDELAAHSERYKKLAGVGVEDLNAQPPILGAMSSG